MILARAQIGGNRTPARRDHRAGSDGAAALSHRTPMLGFKQFENAASSIGRV